MSLYAIPFILQGLFMTVDEFYFQEKKDIPNWEKIEHPIDTLLTLLTLSIPVFFKYNSVHFTVFTVMAIFTSIYIVIHRNYASNIEKWFQSVLFIIHPMSFAAAFLMWSGGISLLYIQFQISLIIVFMLYQIIRWSGPWQRLQR